MCELKKKGRKQGKESFRVSQPFSQEEKGHSSETSKTVKNLVEPRKMKLK